MNYKICAISDTHNRHKQLVLPEADILIHCGDWTFQGLESEIVSFAKWFESQPHRIKIAIPGNHERTFEKLLPDSKKWFTDNAPSCHLLIHDSLEIEGIKFFGSAFTPWFYDWGFLAGRTIEEAAFYKKPFIGDLWKQIPNDTNILITHGPPYNILDEVYTKEGYPTGQFVGCQELLNRIKEVNPDLHFFGHIHYHGGQEHHEDGTSFYNRAVCDERYYPSNPIKVIDYIKE